MSNLIEQLKRDEGLRLKPYQDTVGKWTIGYGRNLEDTGITEEEAEYLLLNDIERVRRDLRRVVPWYQELNREAREAVIENMAFNLGIHGLLRFHATLHEIKHGDYENAARHMMKSLWARQVPNRAGRLAEQMRKGEWV